MTQIRLWKFAVIDVKLYLWIFLFFFFFLIILFFFCPPTLKMRENFKDDLD